MPGTAARGMHRVGRYARVTAILFCLLLPNIAFTQVYKWVDENGVVTFSNIAPPTDQEYKVLRFPCYAADPKCRSVR